MIQTETPLISALSSSNLDKYEYQTDEDLGLKPSTVEEANFEYSPLSKIFIRGLEKEKGKKERLFKSLKNIEGKKEAQLKAIKDINMVQNRKDNQFFSTLSDEAKTLRVDIKQLDNWLNYAQLVCTKTDGIQKYDFSNFTFPLKFASKISNKNFMLQKAEDNQQELEILINRLNNNYNPRNQIKITEKNHTLKSAKKLFFIREDIIRAFRRGIFPYIDRFKVEKESDKESEENNEIDTTDMPDLETEEYAAERRNKQGKRLKIFTLNQMLSRLPISLAQLKEGNNSEELKNEIRQLLYSLYQSKNLQNNFIKVWLILVKNGNNLYEH